MKLKKWNCNFYNIFLFYVFFLIKEKKKIINLDKQNINTKKS